jgi:uncharacterized alkaline shock family protein YloU
MEGHSVISPDVLARYAADAAREVPGVRQVIDTPLQRRGVKVAGDEVEVHLLVERGAIIPEVAAAVQSRVSDYLLRMADVRPSAVNVVVDEVARGD